MTSKSLVPCECGGLRQARCKTCRECRYKYRGLTRRYLREYQAYKNMLARVDDPLSMTFEYYVDVNICDRWRKSFKDFLDDVGPCPSNEHQLDRYPNNDGDYEPGNVRWATRSENTMNRRKRTHRVHKNSCFNKKRRLIPQEYWIQ